MIFLDFTIAHTHKLWKLMQLVLHVELYKLNVGSDCVLY
jgi:hypothetical protein